MATVASLSPTARPLTDRSEVALDQFNRSWRGSSAYTDIMGRLGIDTSKPLKLTDRQRKQVQRELEARGVQFGKGMEIDPAGNVNDDQGLSAVNWKKVGIIGGAAALAAFGLPGVMPGFLTSAPAATGSMATLPANFASTIAPVSVGAGQTAAAAAAAGGMGMWSPSTLRLMELGIGAGTSWLGQRSANKAADRAAAREREALEATLAWEREQDAANRAQYLEERNRDWSRQDARDARMTPYRAGGASAMSAISQLLRERLGRPGAAPMLAPAPKKTVGALSPMAMGAR